MTRTQLLKSLRSLITYHQSCGIDYYHDTEHIRSGVKALDEFSDRESIPEISQTKPTPRSVSHKTESAVGAGVSVEELAREIGGCRVCSLHESRKISTVGRGGAKPRLLIVGDWLVHDTRMRGSELFGIEQDLMLDNMIKAMNLDPGDVFITNIIKCSVDKPYRAVNEHLSACVSYLKQQISLLSPKVICTMGAVASQTLLNTTDSLIGLRGKFHRYVLADGIGIDVMPTFHPTYLLRNPEMKKPTWGDLLAVRKQLDSIKSFNG